MTLDTKSFCQNTRAVLLRDESSLCCNSDGNVDRNQHKQFYEHANESISSHENDVSQRLKSKWSSSLCNKGKDQSCMHANNVLPHMSGYCIKKLIRNKIDECKECIDLFSHGTTLTNEEKGCLEHNMTFLNLNDEGSLIWPKMIVVTLCGILVTTF